MGFPICMFGKTQNDACFKIFVMVFDVGISVVQYIVLYLPVENISCQYVDAAAHQFVDPRIFGKGTVVTVVHHIHSYSCHSYSDDYCQ